MTQPTPQSPLPRLLPPSSKPLISVADVQGYDDTRQIDIDKVGIKEIKHPVRVADADGAEQHTIATFAMLVFLPRQYKGTHMSRFVELLNRREKEISVESFQAMLPEMVERLNSARGVIEMRFPFFVKKRAPVSGVESLLDYDVTFIGETAQGDGTDMTLKVVVPVTSLCPCSKEISEYGAHNQRSHITVTALLARGATVWIEEIVDLVESTASCELWSLLKRPDEKWVTERAYENPKFVEDIVRDAAHLLDQDDRIVKYTVESENFESIHNHSAYALIEKDKRAKK